MATPQGVELLIYIVPLQSLLLNSPVEAVTAQVLELSLSLK